MTNERLQSAMKSAGVDINAIVEATNVDPKTVYRWIKGRVPHVRHRQKVASLLNVREDVIWPTDKAREVITPTQTAEIIAVYAHRADMPSSLWWYLLSQAKQQIDLLGYAMSFLPEQHSGLTALLKRKSSASCNIRIALADPACRQVQERDEEEQLGGTLPALIKSTLHHFRDLWNCAGIEIRYHKTPLYNSIFRFDDEMLVTPHLYGLHGSKAPLLHLRQLGSHGIFANFAAHFEAVWAVTTDVEDTPTFIIRSVDG